MQEMRWAAIFVDAPHISATRRLFWKQQQN
jgi:hypothetical protein